VEQVAVIGAGSWGSALAVHLALVGHEVTLWGRDGSLVEEMASRRANPVYLPDVTFPPGLSPTAELKAALATASIVVVTVPSHGVRAVARQVAPLLMPGAPDFAAKARPWALQYASTLPQGIAQCLGEADVQACLQWAQASR